MQSYRLHVFMNNRCIIADQMNLYARKLSAELCRSKKKEIQMHL